MPSVLSKGGGMGGLPKNPGMGSLPKDSGRGSLPKGMPGVPKTDTMGNVTGMPGSSFSSSSSNPGSGPYKGYLDAANIQMRDPLKDTQALEDIARDQFEKRLGSIAQYQQKGANVAGYQERKTAQQNAANQSWDNYVAANAQVNAARAANPQENTGPQLGKTSTYSGSSGSRSPTRLHKMVDDYKERAHQARMVKLGQQHEREMAYQSRVDNAIQGAANNAHNWRMQNAQLDLESQRIGSQERQQDKQLQGDMYKNYMDNMTGMSASFSGGGGSSYGGYW
jgi:hypothetical protein